MSKQASVRTQSPASAAPKSSLQSVLKPVSADRKPIAEALDLRNGRPQETPATFTGRSEQDDSVRLDLTSSAVRIRDSDADRALATQSLVRQLAPLLGLSPDAVEIRTDVEAESRLSARGAQGLVEDAKIFLHPGRFDPHSAAGRYLLAHETAHLAQIHPLTPVGMGVEAQAPMQNAAAEAEADKIGQAYARRGRVSRPRLSLVRHRPAADSGQRVPPLTESVVRSRSREISEVLGYLSGWWISDGDVFGVMRILDTMPFVVAKALVHSLGRKKRYELADNINPPHIYKHRRSVLATYAALDENQFDAVDLKVFRALPALGLTTEEKEAAYYSIRNLTDSQRQRLLRSENGPVIARLISAPRPSASEAERMRQEAAQAAKEEAELAVQRDAILKHKEDKSIPTFVDRVHALMYPASREEFNPSRNARAALALITSVREPATRFLYIAERLQERGLIDDLLEMLPPSAFFDTAEHTETLIGLVQSRLPSKNTALIEDLLSYGLFDWAIRDHEALFAYRLIKLLPLSEQYRFRQRDGGKWYIRLLENLPDDPNTGKPLEGLEIRKAKDKEEIDRLKTAGIRVDEKEMLFDASQLYARKLQEQGATEALQDLQRAFQEADREGFPKARAQALFRRLTVLGNPSLTPGKSEPADRVLSAAVIHALDTKGYIDKLFSELGDTFLFAEENRIGTVRIMMGLDPARVQRHARELVDRNFLDWMVTDREAYLAYLCVKALPEDDRAVFVADNAEQWGRIQSEMSASMRQSRDLNLYIGDEAGVDRASVLGRLALAKTWTAEQAVELDGLLRMAIAMTEHRFAFERSQEFKAHAKPELAPLVEKYRLYNPSAGREEYRPELLKGTKWYEEGVFATLRTIWAGLVVLWNLDILFVDRSIGVNRLDLNQVQDLLGGDLAGARLADPSQGADKRGAPHPDANKLTLLIGRDGKSAEVILPELLIESANVQLASSTLQSGAVKLKQLHVHAAFDSEALGQPTQAHVSLDRVEANDLLLAKSRSMITVTRLIVQALRLAAGTVDTVTGGVKGPRKGVSIPFPILFVPLLALFILLSLPVYLYKRIEKFITGLESDAGKEFAGDVAERTKSIDFSFASLDVEGITTSGGQHVERVGVRDLAVRVGLNKATRLRAELASLDQRLTALAGKPDAAEAVKKLQKRRAKVEADLVLASAQEREYLEIRKKIRAGGLTPVQQEALQNRLDTLGFEEEGGAFLDIGSIEAEGIRGTVTSKEPLRMENIHGAGAGAVLNQFVGLETATDQELSRRAAAGERPSSLLQEGKPGTFHLEFGQVTTGQVAFGGGVRSLKEIDKKLKELEPNRNRPEIAPSYERLVNLRPKAERYERMVQLGLSALTPRQLEEFRQLRTALTAEADLVLKSIELTQATLDVDLATGGLKLGAQAARITGVSVPEQGLQIGTVEARTLSLDAAGKGGILGWLKWRQNLQDAGVNAAFLQLTDVRHQFKGLLFNKATLVGARARFSDRGDVAEAGARTISIEGLGLVPRLGLMRQRLAGLEKKADPTAKEKQEIARLKESIGVLEGLVEKRAKAFAMREAAKTPEEIEAAKQAILESEGVIAYGLAQYGAVRVEVDELGIRARGAGDVLSDLLDGGLDLERMLKADLTFEGAGKDDMLFRRFAVKGAHAQEDTAKSDLSASLGTFELGEANASVKVERLGTALVITINRFDLASASLSKLLFTSFGAGEGGVQIWSDGTSSLEGLKFSGGLRLEPKAGTEGKTLSDYRLAYAVIDEFRIEKISASGLGYANLGTKTEVAIKSGSLQGIWAKDVLINFPEEAGKSPVVLGSAGVEGINNVQIAHALASGFKVNGGRINGSNIRVDFLQEAETRVSVGDLSLTSVSLRGPDGWARFSLHHLRGRLNIKDGVYRLDNIRLGSFVVKGIDWKVGEKGQVQADEEAKLVGMRLSGAIETEQVPAKGASKPPKAGEKPEQETRVKGVKVTDFHLDSIMAEHLVYQDDSVKIEIKPWDRTMPQSMKDFRPLYLEDFNIKGLRWTKAGGLSAGTVDLAKFQAAASFEDFKTGLKAGFALKGEGMNTKIIGPGTSKLDFGKIQKTGGFFKGAGIDTSFGTGQIVGSVTVGSDFIELGGLKVDNSFLAKTTYKGDDGKTLELVSANVKQISLERVRANMHTVKDDEGREKQEIKEILLDNLELTGIRGGEFDYEGTAKIKDEKGVEGTAKQKIHGDGFEIDRILISEIRRDQIAKLTEVSFEVAHRKEKEPSFKISGLSGEIVKTFGKKKTVVDFSTDVEGGAISGQGIEFKTVSLGKVRQPDGSYAPVTRTAIDGQFQITRIGLLNPDLTLTDENGNKTRIDTSKHKGKFGRIEITGIRPRLLPNGTALIPIDAIRATQLRVTRGPMQIRIPVTEITNFAVALKGMGTEEGMELLAAKASQLSVHGMAITIAVDRSAPSSAARSSAGPSPTFHADALRGLSGELFAEVDWGWDPDIYFPIRGGKLNFEHVHPYAVNLEQGDKEDEVKITIGNFGPTIDALEELPKLKGMHPEQGEYGVIDFKELIEGIMNAPADKGGGGAGEPPADLSGLNDVTFGAHLNLGNGKMGFDTNRSGKLDEGDTFIELSRIEKGQNVITIPRQPLGKRLKVKLPKFRAKGASFLEGKGKTGEITATDLKVEINGLANLQFKIRVYLKEGKIENIRFGDVTFLQAEQLEKVPAPTLKEVNPKGEEGAP